LAVAFSVKSLTGFAWFAFVWVAMPFVPFVVGLLLVSRLANN
jgi:hypothetical protein